MFALHYERRTCRASKATEHDETCTIVAWLESQRMKSISLLGKSWTNLQLFAFNQIASESAVGCLPFFAVYTSQSRLAVFLAMTLSSTFLGLIVRFYTDLTYGTTKSQSGESRVFQVAPNLPLRLSPLCVFRIMPQSMACPTSTATASHSSAASMKRP